MNPEIKAEWLAALRSGEYKQCKSQLRDGDRFCCLGVLCEVFAKRLPGFTYEWQSIHLPEEVCRAADIGMDGRLNTPVDLRERPTRYLTDLNDRGMSFPEIAKVIEEQF